MADLGIGEALAGLTLTQGLAAVGTAVSIGSLVATTMGAGQAAAGAVQQGNAQQTAQDTNAAIATQQAATTTSQADAQAAIDKQNTTRQMGQIIATYGASGVDVGSGSPLDVLSDSASQGELTRQTDLYRGIVTSNADLSQAALDSTAGANAAAAGQITAQGDLTRGAGTVLQGLGKTATSAASLFKSSTSPASPTPTASAAGTPDYSNFQFTY